MQRNVSHPSLVALVLAAGASNRMGMPKALMPWQHYSFLETICRNCLAAAVSNIIVVTGYHSATVRQAHASLPVAWVENPRPENGMLSSLRCGLELLPPEPCSVLLCLTDYPAVRTQTYQALALRACESFIVLPVHAGRRGHPVVFGAGFIPELRNGDCPDGARSVVRAHSDAVVELQTDDPAVLWNINTPEACDRYRKCCQDHSRDA